MWTCTLHRTNTIFLEFMQVDRIQQKHTHTQRHISVYNIYVYIYGTPPPMNYPPSFCVVNTVLNQLSRQVRICISQRFCISQRLPNTNHISIECASQLVQVNVSVRSNATLCSSNQKPISLGKTKKHKNHLLGTLRPNSTKQDVFWFSLGKSCFGVENKLFPRKKLDRKTNFFLGKTTKTKKTKNTLFVKLCGQSPKR